MENRLPAGKIGLASIRLRLPVALIVPLLHQLSLLPVQTLLIPDFFVPRIGTTCRSRLPCCRRMARDPLAGLEFHVNAVPLGQRHLVMHDQFPASVKLFLVHERVITNLGKLVARRLSSHLNETSMLSILRPLWPGITRRSLTRRQRHQGKN